MADGDRIESEHFVKKVFDLVKNSVETIQFRIQPVNVTLSNCNRLNSCGQSVLFINVSDQVVIVGRTTVMLCFFQQDRRFVLNVCCLVNDARIFVGGCK